MNLRRSQNALMQRLVVIYTTRDDQSTLGVILGATSISDLVNQMEAVQSVSNQDVAALAALRAE
jgi:peptidoglycan hydrolase CwlO-like protein